MVSPVPVVTSMRILLKSVPGRNGTGMAYFAVAEDGDADVVCAEDWVDREDTGRAEARGDAGDSGASTRRWSSTHIRAYPAEAAKPNVAHSFSVSWPTSTADELLGKEEERVAH
jgi:hypothetical protein